MKKTIVGLVAATAAAVPLALAGSAHATGAPEPISVSGSSETPVGLPALNSQFTTMTLKVQGDVSWYPGRGDTHLTYVDTVVTNPDHYNTLPDNVQGLPLPDHQVGILLYRIGVDGGAWGAWHEVTNGAITAPNDGRGHPVQILVNDATGKYGDNSGSYNVTITRTK
jgi:hypothetical protein